MILRLFYSGVARIYLTRWWCTEEPLFFVGGGGTQGLKKNTLPILFYIKNFFVWGGGHLGALEFVGARDSSSSSPSTPMLNELKSGLGVSCTSCLYQVRS